MTPTTSEEELAAWTRFPVYLDTATGSATAGTAGETSKAEERTPPSRTALIQLTLIGLSVPLGVLALFTGCAIFIDPLRQVLLERYLTIYGAILATLVLFLAVTFPRVQASVQLSLVFGSLFVIAFSYFCALLSVIIDTAAGFIIAAVQFLGCWELLLLSLVGLELEGNAGRIATYASYAVNFTAVVAIRPPSQMPIGDAIVSAIVMLAVGWGFVNDVCKIVDKIQGDSQN